MSPTCIGRLFKEGLKRHRLLDIPGFHPAHEGCPFVNRLILGAKAVIDDLARQADQPVRPSTVSLGVVHSRAQVVLGWRELAPFILWTGRASPYQVFLCDLYGNREGLLEQRVIDLNCTFKLQCDMNVLSKVNPECCTFQPPMGGVCVPWLD